MDSVTQLRKLGLFDARVPRYTSYPTANHFSDAVGPVEMRDWIRAIPEGAEVSLYVHIPFCRQLCWFCACRTQGTATAKPVDGYLKTLSREIALLRRALPSGVRLSRLHWGGGTPTLLSPDQIKTLADLILRTAPMAPGAEFSIEIDPNEIDATRLDALAAAGVNRASIGVQDFDPEIQATIGREQSFAITKDTADGLRARGITSLNIDILYGLPHQTRSRIGDSVQKVLSLNPDRVALYGYAHVPWMARRQALIPTDALPLPEARLDLFETARNLFAWDGYTEIGIDHFARPADGLARAAGAGLLRRNFQGYTDDQADVLIGLGASAISRFPQGYAQNDPATSRYKAAIVKGSFATVRGHKMSGEDHLRAAMISALMCTFRIDFEDISARQSIDPEKVARYATQVTEAFPGVVALTGGSLEIPPKARPMARMIARALDVYSTGGDAHSAAV